MRGNGVCIAWYAALWDFLIGFCPVRVVFLLQCVLQDERWCKAEVCGGCLFPVHGIGRIAVLFCVHPNLRAAMTTDCVLFEIPLPSIRTISGRLSTDSEKIFLFFVVWCGFVCPRGEGHPGRGLQIQYQAWLALLRVSRTAVWRLEGIAV